MPKFKEYLSEWVNSKTAIGVFCENELTSVHKPRPIIQAQLTRFVDIKVTVLYILIRFWCRWHFDFDKVVERFRWKRFPRWE
jgi:hypothetical protein